VFIKVKIFVVSAPTNVVPTSKKGGENCSFQKNKKKKKREIHRVSKKKMKS
jgi:hypothetical protein